MVWRRKALALALVAIFASAGTVQAASHHHHRYVSATHSRHVGRMAVRGYVGRIMPGKVYSLRGHYAPLVGEPFSGLGFYELPLQMRIAAWRYRMRHAPPPWAVPPVIAAAQAQAARYAWTDPTPSEAYRAGSYNPIDGVGTPFYAGYYGPAGDDDDSSFPFGHPYDR